MKVHRPTQAAGAAVVSAQKNEPGLGHFWTRQDGLRLVLVAEPNAENNSVDASLFCIDEFGTGLFKFQTATFDSPTEVAELMAKGPFQWIRGDADQTRKNLGVGLRILGAIGKEAPEGVAEFKEHLGPGARLSLPPSIYLCPVCDAALPPEIVNAIKEAAQNGADSYMACQRCTSRRQLGAKRLNYVMPAHHRLKSAFRESDTFTLTPNGWDILERAIPLDSLEEAVGLLLTQDVMKGMLYTIERFIADATIPNPQLNDSHIVAALEHLKHALEQNQELKAVDPFEVNFVLEALDEGMALVKQIFREEVETEPDPTLLLNAVEMVLASVRRRSARQPDKREYIQFICNYV
ncbi:MAG: hypothetical protein HY774_20805 [Acidobacteria bacterium]|nr:hypothetical protein [Acidobacteriota bacterium]